MNPDSRIIDDTLPAFKSRFTESLLPGDLEQSNRLRQVDACYSYVKPTPVAAPKTIIYSREVAALLDLPLTFCDFPIFAEVMAGNRLVNNMQPFAHVLRWSCRRSFDGRDDSECRDSMNLVNPKICVAQLPGPTGDR